MLRKEDPRFLVGRGRFVDDIALPNMAHAAVLRSPHAHARIKSIDKRAALQLPGVAAVITGEEAAQETAPLTCFANPPVEQRCVALGKVRHVGEPVALVVADSRYVARTRSLSSRSNMSRCPPCRMRWRRSIRAATPCCIRSAGHNIAEYRNYVFGPIEEEFARAAYVVKPTSAGPAPAASRSRPAARSRASTRRRKNSRSMLTRRCTITSALLSQPR